MVTHLRPLGHAEPPHFTSQEENFGPLGPAMPKYSTHVRPVAHLWSGHFEPIALMASFESGGGASPTGAEPVGSIDVSTGALEADALADGALGAVGADVSAPGTGSLEAELEASGVTGSEEPPLHAAKPAANASEEIVTAMKDVRRCMAAHGSRGRARRPGRTARACAPTAGLSSPD